MPLYEYKCTQCNEKFEKLVRSSFEQGDVHCPSCGSGKVKRLISMFGSLGFSSDSSYGGSSSCGSSGGG